MNQIHDTQFLNTWATFIAQDLNYYPLITSASYAALLKAHELALIQIGGNAINKLAVPAALQHVHAIALQHAQAKITAVGMVRHVYLGKL